MCARPSQPPPDPHDSRVRVDAAAQPPAFHTQAMSGVEKQAVETLSWEVSADSQLPVQNLTPLENRTQVSKSTEVKAPDAQGDAERKLEGSPSLTTSPAAAGTLPAQHRPRPTRSVRRQGEMPTAPMVAAHPVVPGEQPPRSTRRGWPASTISLAVHALILVLLSVFTLGLPLRQPAVDLSWTTVSYPDVEDFQDLQIDPSETLDTCEEQMLPAVVEEILEVGGAAELPVATMLATPTGAAAEQADPGDGGHLLGTDEGAAGAAETRPTGAASASFFGTKVQGKRIVYVLDNSGGMRQGELETLQAELLRSVDGLTSRQLFYIIFYSDALYPLFFPTAPRNFVRATEKNKRRLRQWLDSVEFCLGNVVDEAVAAALSIHPDAIYLLTDGDLDGTRDQRRLRFLLTGTGKKVPIHTVGMGTGETGPAATKLQQVAAANGGTFRQRRHFSRGHCVHRRQGEGPRATAALPPQRSARAGLGTVLCALTPGARVGRLTAAVPEAILVPQTENEASMKPVQSGKTASVSAPRRLAKKPG